MSRFWFRSLALLCCLLGAVGGALATTTPTDDDVLCYPPRTDGETTWCLGPNHDSAGDNDDCLELRTSAVPGQQVKFFVCPDGTSSTSGADATAIHDDVAGEIAALPPKAPPTGADLLLLEDAAAGHAKKQITLDSLTAIYATDAELAAHAADQTSVHGITDTSALLDNADIGNTVQGFDADLADLADGSLTGSKVGFSDPDGNFAAADVQAAVAELDNDNGTGPNQADFKVHWSQIGGMPSGFVDGTDDGAGGGSGDITGPASVTDNALTRWDGTSGNLLQNSLVLVDDAGLVTAPGGFASSANATDGGAMSLGEDSDVGSDSWKLAVGQTNLPAGTTTCTLNSSGRIPDSCVGDGVDDTGAGGSTTECLHVTVATPNDLADALRDDFPVWHNRSGSSFVISSWHAEAGADNTTLAIEEINADGTSRVTVDAVEIATNGTAIFTGTDSTITAGTIEDDHKLRLDFDDTDTPPYVQMTICGEYQ